MAKPLRCHPATYETEPPTPVGPRRISRIHLPSGRHFPREILDSSGGSEESLGQPRLEPRHGRSMPAASKSSVPCPPDRLGAFRVRLRAPAQALSVGSPPWQPQWCSGGPFRAWERVGSGFHLVTERRCRENDAGTSPELRSRLRQPLSVNASISAAAGRARGRSATASPVAAAVDHAARGATVGIDLIGHQVDAPALEPGAAEGIPSAVAPARR